MFASTHWMVVMYPFLYMFLRKNYLQLDIFYKELTERNIVQQKAYELAALLGTQNISSLKLIYSICDMGSDRARHT